MTFKYEPFFYNDFLRHLTYMTFRCLNHLIFPAFYFEVSKKTFSNFWAFFPMIIFLSSVKFNVSSSKFIMDHKFQWPQQGLNCEYISYNMILFIRKLRFRQEVSSSNHYVVTGICDKSWVSRSYLENWLKVELFLLRVNLVFSFIQKYLNNLLRRVFIAMISPSSDTYFFIVVFGFI